MPTIVNYTKTLYQYAELSESAKANARDWYRECIDSNDFDYTLADASTCAAILGIEIQNRPFRTIGGSVLTEPNIYWQLHVQGSGASFTGFYAYAKGSAKAIRDHAPQDKTLHAIADRLQATQRQNFYKLVASISKSGIYYHSMMMDVSVTTADDEYRNVDAAAEEITSCMRDFADWIYRQVQQEYDYQTSDEVIEETILANEYTFTESGKRDD